MSPRAYLSAARFTTPAQHPAVTTHGVNQAAFLALLHGMRAWAETLKQLQEQLTDLGSTLQDMLEMITNLHERVANLESSLAKS